MGAGPESIGPQRLMLNGFRFSLREPGMTKAPFIKIRHKFATGSQLFRQNLGAPKPQLHCERCTLLSKKGPRLSMPIFKYFTYVGSALLVLLFVSNAYLTDDESICGLTDRCTPARFTRLAWRKPRPPRSVALPAMSRLPFALGKCLPCSSPMSDDATSVIHNIGLPVVETGGHSVTSVTSPVSSRRTIQPFGNGSGPPPLSPGLSISLHSRCEPSPKPVLFS